MSKHQINQVMIEGNLTEDPRAREFTVEETGEVVAATTLRVANNRVKRGTEQVNYVTVEAVGSPAAFANSYLHKGDEVIVVGEVKQDRWEDNGQKRSTLLVLGKEVHGRRKAGGEKVPAGAAVEPEGAPDDIPF